MHNSVCAWPRGKILGGTSAINYMAWVFGHHNDFDEWKEHEGANFSYEHMYRCFKKCENVKKNKLLKNRGNEGPVKIRTCNRNELIDKFVDTCNSIGIKKKD